ncbi:MAG: hypothetical protein AB2598_20030 [Candidatus Thiodiazotropha sp.]
MNNDQNDFESIQKQLSGIKLWVAVGAIGFLIIGAAAAVVSVTMATMMGGIEEEYENEVENDSLWDEASDYFDRGEKERLLSLVEKRMKTHPYDAQVYWFRARAHILDENWEAALADVEHAQFLAPSWGSKYTIPMAEALRNKIENEE